MNHWTRLILGLVAYGLGFVFWFELIPRIKVLPTQPAAPLAIAYVLAVFSVPLAIWSNTVRSKATALGLATAATAAQFFCAQTILSPGYPDTAIIVLAAPALVLLLTPLV